MTTDNDIRGAGDAQLDRVARALHAQAVAHVPARTLRRLRTPRASSTPARAVRTTRTFGWVAVAACAAVVAIAIGLRPDAVAPTPGDVATAPTIAVTDVPDSGSGNDAYADALASLDEDPGFYLWLASSDVQPLAME